MRSRSIQLQTISALLLLAAVALIAGCGEAAQSLPTKAQFAPSYRPPADAERGGLLRVLGSGDVDSLDPGLLQNQFAAMVSFATQRTLISPKPGPGPGMVPDLAAGLPTIDRAGGRVEFRIRRDVRFSAPVSRRIVAADFKYALERGLLPGISNGYARAYLDTLRGFSRAEREAETNPGRAPDIAGIEVRGPDRLRLQFSGKVPPLAVSAAVDLILLSAAMASTRSSMVSWGTYLDLELRSTRPASSSAKYRASTSPRFSPKHRQPRLPEPESSFPLRAA